MKKILAIILALTLCLALAAPVGAADAPTSGTCGEKLTWNLSADGTLTISGTGPMYDYDYAYYHGEHWGEENWGGGYLISKNDTTYAEAPWAGKRYTIKNILIKDGVTSIGDYSFAFCDNLASIIIPSGVTRIGMAAFHDCESLPNIDIPSSVTSIGDGAFSGCESLTSVSIPNGVTKIGIDMFFECSNLVSVNIPDSVTMIGMEAFRGCGRLTSVNIPNSVTNIGAYAFWYCTNLTSVNIPDGMTRIRSCLFRNCSRLTSVNISDGVTSIGTGAFLFCPNLTSLTIPASVDSIGLSVFQGCVSLSDIYYGGDETEWNDILIGGDFAQVVRDGYLIDIDDLSEVDELFVRYEIVEIEKVPMGKSEYAPITSATIHYNGAAPDAPTPAVSVTVDGVAVTWTDAAPFIDENDRTMVPLRAVADVLGLTVDWFDRTREASFTNGTKAIVFPIGSSAARTSDSGTITMDTAAVIVNDRTYAPVRYLAEYFGRSVTWDGATRTVKIS